MSKKKHTSEQMVQILREAEMTDESVEVFCRRKEISTVSFYRWRTKFGGMEILEARRLKDLEQENARLKKLLADVMLANDGLKDVLAKKG